LRRSAQEGPPAGMQNPAPMNTRQWPLAISRSSDGKERTCGAGEGDGAGGPRSSGSVGRERKRLGAGGVADRYPDFGAKNRATPKFGANGGGSPPPPNGRGRGSEVPTLLVPMKSRP